MKDNFKEKIFSKIEKEQIKPLSESYFANKRRILWFLIGTVALFAILFGGFLLNDSIEFFGMRGYRGGNFGFLILPHILWIVFIGLLVLIGINIFRNTPTGHRYSYVHDIIIGITIVVAGSLLMKGVGLCPVMHSFFIDNIPSVSNIIYKESSWNDPSNGRLVGTILEINNNNIKLKSVDGSTWDIAINNALISPMVSLNTNEELRILGKKSGNSHFEAERIMPWFGQGTGIGGGFLPSRGMMQGSGFGGGMMR